ncbi:MAG: Cell division protein FtsA [Candidatus Berkelbacteria bacterium]|nr:Cell division protein FtsA [Candidatus Berkelbacteria bacterium]
MPKDNLFVGLDVGSTKVAACCGEIVEGMINICGLRFRQFPKP